MATEWRSYMEGALQSGERASAEVLKAMEMNTNIFDQLKEAL